MNNHIKEIRIQKGMTLLQLAEKLGLSESTVQRYESGNIKRMNYDIIVEMAEILDCDPAYMMGFKNEVEGENSTLKKEYYKDAAIVAQKILENRELQLLFEDAVDAKPDDLQTAHSVLLAMKRKERGND